MKKYLLIFMVLAVALVVFGCKKENSAQEPAQPTNPNQTTPQKAGPPTPLEKGETPEQRVDKYFVAYKDGKLEEAYDMQPKETKAKQTKEEFLNLRKSMPITEYKVLPTQTQGDQSIIAVEYSIGQYGTWVSTWVFEKQDGKWMALRYTASPKQ